MKTTLILLIGCLALTACNTDDVVAKATIKPGQATPINTAAANTDAATTKVDVATTAVASKSTERDSKVRSNIQHARVKNQDNPDGALKTVVDGDLEVADAQLADVPPDPVETAARERDAKLVEAGKAAEARANYATAASDAKQLTADLALAKKAQAQAIVDRDTARAAEKAAQDKLLSDLAQNKLDNQRIIDQLNSEHAKALEAERNKMFHVITYALIACAVVCVLIGAFSAYAKVQLGDVLHALIVGAVWGGAAMFCVACAWTINQWWFKWVLIGGCSLGLVALVLYVWAEVQSSKGAKTRMGEADEAEDTLKKVMGAVESTVDSTAPAGAALLATLRDKLDGNNKALVNELKAEVQRG